MSLLRDEGADDYLPGHGDTDFDVTHYDLDLKYNVERNRLSGDARLECVAREDLEEIALDLHSLEVSKVTLDGRPVKHKVRRDKVLVWPEDEIPLGDAFTLTVRYAGHPRPLRSRHLGTAGWEELTDGVIVAGQPHGAPSWFPCNDRPSNKASYRTSISTSPGYRVVANGRLVDTRRRSSAVTWVYEQDEPMATYLATVHIGRYEIEEVDGPVPTYAVLPKRLLGRYDAAFGDQPAMIETFIRLFGPYPFESYTVVVTDDDLEIPLESQGLSTFGANFLTSDWEAVRLVAHELSHQWFGNSLTLTSWKDIWLHEGFACYAEWLWSEESGGPSAQEWATRHHARLDDLDQDLLLSDPGPDLMFDDRVYKRGCAARARPAAPSRRRRVLLAAAGVDPGPRTRVGQHRRVRGVHRARDRPGPDRPVRRLAQPRDPPPATCLRLTRTGRTPVPATAARSPGARSRSTTQAGLGPAGPSGQASTRGASRAAETRTVAGSVASPRAVALSSASFRTQMTARSSGPSACSSGCSRTRATPGSPNRATVSTSAPTDWPTATAARATPGVRLRLTPGGGVVDHGTT